MKQDKADKIIKKAELKAKKAAQQVQVAGKKAEAAKKKQELKAQKKAERIQKKASKAADKATKKAAQKTKKAEAVAKKAQLAAKKADEKKARAVAKAAAKAVGKAPKAEGEGGEDAAAPKKKSKKKLLLIAVPVVAAAVAVGVFFFLRGDKEEEDMTQPIPAPAEYLLNEHHISALPVWGEALVYREEIQPPAEAEGADDGAGDAQAAEDGEDTEAGGDAEASGDAEDADAEAAGDEEVFQKVLYRYEGLQSPVDLVSAYTALMTTEDAGFSTVDETLLRIDPPEFEGMTRGSVQLARNVPEAEDGTGGGVHSLLLSWEGNTCSVMLDMPEGSVHDPAPEPPAPITHRGLSDLEALPPSKLGLPGDSMDAYELMPKEGSVRIKNSVCMRVDVYDGNSQIAGSYFLSNDGHLYKLDEASNAVVELDWE